MNRAIEKAIYYLDSEMGLNPVIVFEYENEESFQNILRNLHENIEIVATFGQKDNFCYEIFNTISNMYTTLLLYQTTSLYIVNRKDVSIKLIRKQLNCKERIAVIKLDAILSEYHPTSYTPYLLYPFTFLLGGILAVPLMKNLSN